MKENTKAYTAGLIDAEGCLSISQHTRDDGHLMYDPLIRLTNTHRPTMKWVVETFGGHLKTRQNGFKEYYQWRYCSDLHASKFLALIQPYLILKKAEADVLASYYSLRGQMDPSARLQLYERMKELKQRESLTTNTPNFPFKRNLVNAYFAGFFDGEGSICIIKVKQGRGSSYCYRSVVSLGNTSKSMVAALKHFYGGNFRERPPHRGTLPMFQWDLTRVAEQELFLLAILPYLKIKRKQAENVLQMIRIGKTENPVLRQKHFEIARVLNGKKIESDLTGHRKSMSVVIQNI